MGHGEGLRKTEPRKDTPQRGRTFDTLKSFSELEDPELKEEILFLELGKIVTGRTKESFFLSSRELK